ncbi:MAG: M23 family metallopeptidase [Proteobacteria bacterium]|nr:MAG: M23 family metallopeptidase [Pseudomonadota bacterium]
MNLIFFSRREGRTLSLNLSHPIALSVMGCAALAVLGVAFALGLQFGQRSSLAHGPASIGVVAREKQAEVLHLREQVQDRIDAISLRIGQVNAHLIRLDALGSRLAQMANISSREFNFESEPSIGGPEELDAAASGAAHIPDLTQMLESVERRLDTRDAQLLALENAILSRKLHDAIQPDGRPVVEGFISSYYGERQDPFTGHEAQHRGMDFAGEAGSKVVAVAAGIVTWSGERSGFGHLVEVNHGNGYVTRYAHNQRGLVNVGETVTRGEAVALMGSTGRSTGPHVHFEVLKNGQQVNPLTFIGR